MSAGRRACLLIVAGGTGGHIWPAISFGQWAGGRYSSLRVEYVSGSRELEREIYGYAGIKQHVLPLAGSPFGAPGRAKLGRCKDAGRAFFRMRRLIRETSPSLCVVFGGYISAPALAACTLLGIPLLAHEQNARAGRFTKLARRMGVPIAAGWDICEPLGLHEFTHTGIPVRPFASRGRERALRDLGLPGERFPGPAVAVMSGSLGSDALGESIRALAASAEFADWRFIVVDKNVEETRYANERIILMPKRWDIGPLYEIADILVVRGGASTLAEAEESGKPTLVAPWKDAADGHQIINARTFARRPGVLIWDEQDESIEDFRKKIRILGTSYESGGNDTCKRMYNPADGSCMRLWKMALEAAKGEICFEGKHNLH